MSELESPRTPVSEDAGAAPRDLLSKIDELTVRVTALVAELESARARLSAVEAERERMREVCQRAVASSSGPGSAP